MLDASTLYQRFLSPTTTTTTTTDVFPTHRTETPSYHKPQEEIRNLTNKEKDINDTLHSFLSSTTTADLISTAKTKTPPSPYHEPQGEIRNLTNKEEDIKDNLLSLYRPTFFELQEEIQKLTARLESTTYLRENQDSFLKKKTERLMNEALKGTPANKGEDKASLLLAGLLERSKQEEAMQQKLNTQEEALKQRSAELDHRQSKLRTQEEALNKSLVEQQKVKTQQQQKVKTHQQKMSAQLDQQQSKLGTQEEALNKCLAEQQKVKIPPKDVLKTIAEDQETKGPRNPKNQRDAADICEWGEDNLKDCYDLLWEPTQNASMWHFIADSTLGRLFEPLRSTWKVFFFY